MKISCNIIKDILPLYVENLAGEDTRRMVEEHTASCEGCRNLLEEMGAPVVPPVDADAGPLRKLKEALRKNKLQTITFSVMFALAAAIVAAAFLTAPRYIPYSENAVTIQEKDDGAVLAIFSDEVSGFDLHRYTADIGTGDVFHVIVWDSIWSRYLHRKTAGNTVLNPGGEAVASVYYFMPYKSGEPLHAGDGDILIYGLDQHPGGGVVILPRLVLTYYALFAAVLSVLCGIAMRMFRRQGRVRNALAKLLLLPLSYIFGSLCLKGLSFSSYSASRDFYIILLVTVPMYFLFYSAAKLLQEIRRA